MAQIMNNQKAQIESLEKKINNYRLKESVAIQQKKIEGSRSVIGQSFVVNGQSFISTDGTQQSPSKKRRNQISSESGTTGNMQIKEDSEEYEVEKKTKEEEEAGGE